MVKDFPNLTKYIQNIHLSLENLTKDIQNIHLSLENLTKDIQNIHLSLSSEPFNRLKYFVSQLQ